MDYEHPTKPHNVPGRFVGVRVGVKDAGSVSVTVGESVRVGVSDGGSVLVGVLVGFLVGHTLDWPQGAAIVLVLATELAVGLSLRKLKG